MLEKSVRCSYPGHNHGTVVTGGGAGGGSFGIGDNGVMNSSGSTTGITVGNNTNAGGSHPNIQPTLVLNYIIKT